MTKHRNDKTPMLAHMAHRMASNSPNNQPFNVHPRPASRKARTAKQARQRENQMARIAVQSKR